jgi:hypothetical protein
MNKLTKGFASLAILISGLIAGSNSYASMNKDATENSKMKYHTTSSYIVDGDTLTLDSKVNRHHTRNILTVKSKDGSTSKFYAHDGIVNKLEVQRFDGDKTVAVPGLWNYSGLNNVSSVARQETYSRHMKDIKVMANAYFVSTNNN